MPVIKIFQMIHFTFYRLYFSWKPMFMLSALRWKDKFESPRCELEPHLEFKWLWFGLYATIGDDNYWEQWLWVHQYSGGDVKKAEETWPWSDFHTKESTWTQNKYPKWYKWMVE